MNKFRLLKAEEIECRVGSINENGFTLLLYKDARCDQNILDETVGEMNWQRDHKELKGNIYCGVSIYDATEKGQWITKWDCGAESNTEKEKGEASDSFKRACVNWGIGRELYTAPFIYIKGNVKAKTRNGKEIYVPTLNSIKVTSIAYAEGKIIDLVITGDGDEIFTMDKRQTAKPQPQEKEEAPSFDSLLMEAKTTKFKSGKYEGEFIFDCPTNYLEYCVQNGKNEHFKAVCQAVLDDRYFEQLDSMKAEEDLPF